MTHYHATRGPELLRFAAAERRHADALARATGQCFNVFKVLGVGHYETRTHSPILGDLLNPKGSHGQGGTFLKLFLDSLGIEDFDPKSARVELEYRIGAVSEASGGRIDIVIRDHNGEIIYIENKIFAKDQERQLQRYRANNDRAHLIYLTRFGVPPEGLSKEECIDLRCKCISYAHDIRNWLEACRRESACAPHVRECLSQYIQIIEELTNQSARHIMNDQLRNEILRDPESLGAFFALHSQYDDIRALLIQQFDDELGSIAARSGLTLTPGGPPLREKDASRRFTSPELDRVGLQIIIGFDAKECQEFYFGFARNDPKKASDLESQLLLEFAKQFTPQGTTAYVPICAYWKDYQSWWNETLLAIKSHQLAKDLEARLKCMLGMLERVSKTISSTTDESLKAGSKTAAPNAAKELLNT